MTAANFVLIALLCCVTLQIFGYYIGCKNQCLLSHENLKRFLVINRTLSLILYIIWVKMEYRQLFHSHTVYNIIAILFILSGQYLNYIMYYKLGSDFVYYGKEYNLQDSSKEYISEFPFNLHHPQYIGIILTIIGIFFLNGFEKNGAIRKKGVYVIIYVVILYLISMAIENDCYRKEC
jgi:hypothetical protein